MLSSLYKCLDFFSGLPPLELHQKNVKLRKQLANTEWLLSVALLASQRNNLYRKLEHTYSDIYEYARKCLNLANQKTGELLHTARALEKLPLISDAFRTGTLSWGKVRELKRVATPETEKVWLDFALGHDVTVIQRQVALSPREWKRGRALAASEAGQPTATAAVVSELLTGTETTTTTESPVTSGVTKADPQDSDQSPPIPAPNLIRLVHYLTPDEFAVYEQAQRRVRARNKGARMKREAILMEWCDNELSAGTAKSRARYQVLIHTGPGGGAWYETERGLFPASPQIVAEARAQGRVIELHPDERGEPEKSNPGDKSHLSDEQDPTSHGKTTGRRDYPNALVRYLFAQAGNRCQRCGSYSRKLHIHHRLPVSDGGGDQPELLELLCTVCHALEHEPDFESRPDWAQARERALIERGLDSS